MDSPVANWPNTQWKLSAPESYVLLHGPNASGAEVFKAAVTELASRGALKITRVEQSGALGFGRGISVLAQGTGGSRLDGPPARILELHGSLPLRSYPDGTVGAPVEALAQAVLQRYGSLDGYVSHEVMPALIERGLYSREEYRKFFVVPASRYVLTPAGQAARAELEGLVALGSQQFGGWTRQDPGRALAFMGMAGAAMMLMPMLFGDIEALNAEGLDIPGDLDFAAVDPAALGGLDSAVAGLDVTPEIGSGGLAGGEGLAGGAGFDSGGFDGGFGGGDI
jgi:hypothetical protein